MGPEEANSTCTPGAAPEPVVKAAELRLRRLAAGSAEASAAYLAGSQEEHEEGDLLDEAGMKRYQGAAALVN